MALVIKSVLPSHISLYFFCVAFSLYNSGHTQFFFKESFCFAKENLDRSWYEYNWGRCAIRQKEKNKKAIIKPEALPVDGFIN
jgi:hypothetical protein